jgi:hypothetical protein
MESAGAAGRCPFNHRAAPPAARAAAAAGARARQAAQWRRCAPCACGTLAPLQALPPPQGDPQLQAPPLDAANERTQTAGGGLHGAGPGQHAAVPAGGARQGERGARARHAAYLYCGSRGGGRGSGGGERVGGRTRDSTCTGGRCRTLCVRLARRPGRPCHPLGPSWPQPGPHLDEADVLRVLAEALAADYRVEGGRGAQSAGRVSSFRGEAGAAGAAFHCRGCGAGGWGPACRHSLFRPYLRMMPPPLPQTRLRRGGEAGGGVRSKPSGRVGQQAKAGRRSRRPPAAHPLRRRRRHSRPHKPHARCPKTPHYRRRRPRHLRPHQVRPPLPYSLGWLFHTFSKPIFAGGVLLTTGLASALRGRTGGGGRRVRRGERRPGGAVGARRRRVTRRPPRRAAAVQRLAPASRLRPAAVAQRPPRPNRTACARRASGGAGGPPAAPTPASAGRRRRGGSGCSGTPPTARRRAGTPRTPRPPRQAAARRGGAGPPRPRTFKAQGVWG